MVTDTISNLKKYTSLNGGIECVIKFIHKHKFAELSDGKHMLEKGVFLIVSAYQTKSPDQALVECHRKYVDIQLVVSGAERFGFASVDDCIAEEYNDDKDVQFLSGTLDFLQLKPGNFVICFPGDAHQPGLNVDNEPSEVKKFVFKLPVELQA